MKPAWKKISNILLLPAVCGTGLVCCSVIKTSTSHTDAPTITAVPKELLNFKDGTVYGLAEGVTIDTLFKSGYDTLDLTNGHLETQTDIIKIAPYAFANIFTGTACPIHTLALPDTLLEVGQGAFYCCRALKGELYLPHPLKTIGQDAFFYTGFTNPELIIPENVEKIGVQAFWHIDTLSGTIKIPSTVKEVGFRAFKDAHNVKKLDLSEYDTIPAWLCKQNTIFQDLGQSVGSVEVDVNTNSNTVDDWKTMLSRQGIDESLMVITSVSEKVTPPSCFTYDDPASKTTVTGLNSDDPITNYNIFQLPDTVTTIKEGAFKDKIKQNIQFRFPTKVEVFEKEAFKNCSGLICNNIDIPVTITKMGDSVFENCTGIGGILNFPTKPQEEEPSQFVIEGNNVFKGCTRISGIRVKTSDCFKGYGMFQNCSSLSYIDISDYKDIYETEAEELWARDEDKPDDHLSLGGIAPSGIVYYFEDGNILQQDVPTFLGYVGGGDLQYNSGPAVVDPSQRPNWQVQSYADEAAVPDMDGYILENKEKCHGITKKYKPDITNYNTIRIPNVVTSIEAQAFKGVLAKKGRKTEEAIDRWQLILNLGINEIKDSAFAECDGIVDKLNLPSTITKIGNKAFINCRDICDILEFPSLLESIGDSSFQGTGINKVVFPKTINNIGAKAFFKCNFIKALDFTSFTTFPTDLTIGEDAFNFLDEQANDDPIPSTQGIVYVHKGTKDSWQNLLKQKGLVFSNKRWEIKEVE